MSRRKGAAYLIMVCFVAKHLLSNSYGIFDRFVEIGVFLLIAYEVGVGIVRHRRQTKREKGLDSKVASMSGFMNEGRKLLDEVPRPNLGAETVEDWRHAASKWTMDVHGLLQECSPRAAASFMLIASIGVPTNPQVVHAKSGSFPIEGSYRESYQKLLAHLGNLRSIMEKPEAYF